MDPFILCWIRATRQSAPDFSQIALRPSNFPLEQERVTARGGRSKMGDFPQQGGCDCVISPNQVRETLNAVAGVASNRLLFATTTV